MSSPTPSPAWQALEAHRDEIAAPARGRALRRGPRARARLHLLLRRPGGGLLQAANDRRDPRAPRGARTRARTSPGPSSASSPGSASTTPRTGPPCTRRCAATSASMADGEDVLAQVQRCRERMRVFATAVRDGNWKGATGKPVRHVLSLGIGGSYLGPRLAVEALTAVADGPGVRFVANVDPAALDDALAGLDPASTLVVVASKTFTTQETMANASAAAGGGSPPAWARKPSRGTWWRPRRTSPKPGASASRNATSSPSASGSAGASRVWSSVGLPVAIAVGMPAFERFLAGAHAVDLAFRSAPLERNVPFLLAATGVWNRNFLGIPRARRAALRAAPGEPAGLPAAARDGIQRQARGRRRRAPSPGPPARPSSARRARWASTRSTSGCTRARERSRATSSSSRAPWAGAGMSTPCCSPTRSRSPRRS